MNNTKLNNLRKMGGVTTLFVGILAISNPVDAISLIGNYSSTNDGNSTVINVSSITTVKAVGFTLPTGNNYTLDDVVLRLGNYNTTTDGDTALLQIYKDAAKTSINPTEATLESLLFINPSSSDNTSSNFTFTPQSTFTFLADTRYWLQLSVTAGNSINWTNNSPSITPTGVATYQTYLYGNYGAAATGSSSIFNSFDIQVTQSVPFDFDPSFGVAVLGGGWLLRKHLKKKKSTKV
jgi:hypothetical protein